MLSVLLAASILGGLAGVEAQGRSAFGMVPSAKWYGPDGNWSAFQFIVGVRTDVAQVRVDLQISTTLAETWVISDGGCGGADNLCKNLRGGVVNETASTTWKGVGPYQLGLGYLGLKGNGDYGLDTLAVENAVTDNKYFSMNNAVIAAINDTDYFTGFFGLGLTAGRFGTTVTQSPLEQAVVQDQNAKGGIASRSYGYTAGAYYANDGQGVPASLTLGGYDQKRFVPHQNMFVFNSSGRLPEALIRGITAVVPTPDQAPKHWQGSQAPLLAFNDSITALIDTTTPFLWLPGDICDQFAAALNLTYNSSLDLYTFQTGELYEDYIHSSPLNLTFTLSSFDNYDNFGHPLSVNGVVNVTVPIAAFAQLAKYPYLNKIGPYDSAVPYFPLKRAVYGNRYILGRAFMQAAYLIMRYEEGLFSVHQALFPDDPINNRELHDIVRPNNSLYALPPVAPNDTPPLSTGQMAGIVFAACAIMTAAIFSYWCVRRRRRARDVASPEDTVKDGGSSFESAEPPKSPVGRILSIMKWRKAAARRQNTNVVAGTRDNPAEVGGKDNEVYELPVPVEPVELDSGDASLSTNVDETSELGTESTRGLSGYELARRKIERQLQGPVPAYSPSAAGTTVVSAEAKSDQDVSPVAHYRPSDNFGGNNGPPSPLSSPIHGTFAIPSPITPHGDWGHFPSPMSVAPPIPAFPNPYQHLRNAEAAAAAAAAGSVARSNSLPSSEESPTSAPTTFNPSTVSPSNSTHVSAGAVSSEAGGLSHPRSSPNPSSTSPHISPPHSPDGSSPVVAPSPSSPTFQRTPIDPSRVVCLGPLPDNVQLPRQPSLPRRRAPGAASAPVVAAAAAASGVVISRSASPLSAPPPLGTLNQAARESTETLGSNFTDEESERIAEEMTRNDNNNNNNNNGNSVSPIQTQSQGSIPNNGGAPPAHAAGLRVDTSLLPPLRSSAAALARSPLTASTASPAHHHAAPLSAVTVRSQERIEAGDELVHVPQLAARRYSWEEEGTR